jgi:rfaE bifunctional protein kinase chain/domain
MDVSKLKQQFSTKKVLVIGDAMIDAYYMGSVSRISPEAPVPVIEIKEKSKRLGGAANVALNIDALGAKVALCCLCGEDENAIELKKLCSDVNINTDYFIQSNKRATTVKTRVISRGQHLLRVDEENREYACGEEELLILKAIENAIIGYQPDVVIFEDYNKGMLTKKAIHLGMKLCVQYGMLSTVDPKFINFEAFKGANVFKPNLKEIQEGLKQEIDPTSIESLDYAAQKFMDAMAINTMFITLSEHGVYFKESGKRGNKIAAHQRKIIDVSGAGDTVISIASLALVSGLSKNDAFALANLGGGMVCEEEGVVPIDIYKLLNEADKV